MLSKCTWKIVSWTLSPKATFGANTNNWGYSEALVNPGYSSQIMTPRRLCTGAQPLTELDYLFFSLEFDTLQVTLLVEKDVRWFILFSHFLFHFSRSPSRKNRHLIQVCRLLISIVFVKVAKHTYDVFSPRVESVNDCCSRHPPGDEHK